jgi:two-component system, NarL family, nitrate/nitrite response regulator NarL
MNSPAKRIRILVFSNHAMFRNGLKLILEAETGFSVVGVTGGSDHAVKLAVELEPDIVLFDVNHRQLHSTDADLQVLRQLASKAGKARTILLCAFDEASPVVESLKFGVRGVVRREASVPLLFKCIRSVMDGVYWISHDTTCELIKSLESLNSRLENWSKLLNCRLSERELQVIKEIISGSSNKDIARELSISEQAVKYHLTNIFSKTGICGRMELARFAIRHQLVQGA